MADHNAMVSMAKKPAPKKNGRKPTSKNAVVGLSESIGATINSLVEERNYKVIVFYIDSDNHYHYYSQRIRNGERQ